MRTKNNFIYLFLLVLIVSIFSIEVDAVSLTQLQTNTLSFSRGTAGLFISPTGDRIFAFDNWHGTYPNSMSIYGMTTPYDLSTLFYAGTLNITAILPSQYQNLSLSTAYLSNDGLNMYLVLANSSSDLNTFAGHRVNFTLLHYTMDLPYIFDDLNFSDWNAITTLTGTTPSSPSIFGIWVDSSGSNLILSGRSFVSTSDIPRFWAYTMASPNNLTQLYLNGTTPSIVANSWSSFASYTSIWVDNTQSNISNAMIFYIPRDINQNHYDTYFGSPFISNFTATNILPLTNREGQTIVSTFGNIYLFNQGGGIIYKYQINNLTQFTQNNNVTTSANAQAYQNAIINPIISIFPEASTLSFAQRWAFVLVTMLITAIILLFASSRISSEGIHKFMVIIIGGVLFVEFIFFCAIRYVDTGIWIGLILIGTAILLIKIFGGHK